jgi:hypothetical protein
MSQRRLPRSALRVARFLLTSGLNERASLVSQKLPVFLSRPAAAPRLSVVQMQAPFVTPSREVTKHENS